MSEISVEFPQSPPSVEQRMHTLQTNIDSNVIPVFQGLDMAYELTAERMEQANPSNKVREVLNEVFASSEAANAFSIGFQNISKPNRINPADAEIVQAINNTFGEEKNMINYSFLQRLTGTFKSSQNENALSTIGHWRSLYADLKSSLPADIQGLVCMEMVAIQTFKQVRESAHSLLDTKVTRTVMPGKEKEFFIKKLAGPDGSRYIEGYSARILPLIVAKGEEIFGADTPRALGLLRSMAYLETSKIQRKPGETLSGFRTPILEAIGKRDFAKAEAKLHELVLRYPHAFSQKYHEVAGVTVEDLRSYQEANEEQRRQIVIQKEQEQLAKEQARVSKLLQQMSYDSSPETIQMVLDHQGDAIMWEEIIDLQNGDQLTERKIGYIGIQGTKVVPYKNAEGRLADRTIPAFEFRTYVVRDGKAQYSTTAVLRSSTLLKRVEKSSKLPDPTRFATGTEIML